MTELQEALLNLDISSEPGSLKLEGPEDGPVEPSTDDTREVDRSGEQASNVKERRSNAPPLAYARVMLDHPLLTRDEEGELGKAIHDARQTVVDNLSHIPLASEVFVRAYREADRGERPSTDVFFTPFSVDVKGDDPVTPAAPKGRRSKRKDGTWRAAGRLIAQRYARWQGASGIEAREKYRALLTESFRQANPSWVCLTFALEACERQLRQTRNATGQSDPGAFEVNHGVTVSELEQRTRLAAEAQRRYVRARDRLVNANLRLVHHQANSLRDHGIDFDDLVQEAIIGLLRAIDRFDFSLGYKFSTYAVTWIRQSTTLALANASRTVRVPAYVHERSLRVRRMRDEFLRLNARDPTLTELADLCDLDEAQVRQGLEAASTNTSLDAPSATTEDASLYSVLADPDSPSPDQIADTGQAVGRVEAALNRLPPREALIVRMRQGIGVRQAHKLEQIGAHLGITRERARQLEARALEKLRAYLLEDEATEPARD